VVDGPALADPYRRYLSALVQFHVVAAAEIGLTGTDFQASNLLDVDGAMTSGELAHRLALSTSAATRVIDRLVAAGWARRVADPGDRRRVLVEPTGQLPDRLSEAVEAVRAPIGDVVSALSEEQREGLLAYFEVAAQAYAAVARDLRDDARPGTDASGSARLTD
jgi:DNA-binding MarR family transcriptional regulator